MASTSVPVVWSPTTREHVPVHEVWVGVATPGTEVPARVDAILESLGAAGHRLLEAPGVPDEWLGGGNLRVRHDDAGRPRDLGGSACRGGVCERGSSAGPGRRAGRLRPEPTAG